MPRVTQPSDRLAGIVRSRLAPALAEAGFVRRRTAFAARRGELRWLVDIELAPWSTPERVSATLAWGVQVPGLPEVLGDRVPPSTAPPWGCPVHGRAGEGDGDLAAAWHDVRAHWWPVDHLPPVTEVLDARTGAGLLHDLAADVLPALARFEALADVQAHLAERLDRAPRTTSTSDLSIVRTIFALSVLRGDRCNAERWLDYLEARSATTMAPDLVAERLSPLRRLVAA